jgi:2-polyprenyl-6-methoxyphenol hydroxylase-like FAD-dependent oxidoreductase
VAAALALSKCGVPVTVLERTGGLRAEGSSIGMWTNAFRALDALGVADELRGRYPPLERVIIRDGAGNELRSTRVADCTPAGTHEARCVLRADLVETIAAKLPPGSVHFDAGVVGARTEGDGAVVTLADGSSARCAAVVGADGVGSAVAASLGLPPPRYVGYTAVRGVADFGDAGLPAGLSPATIHFYYGDGVRAGAIPFGGGRTYFFTVSNEPDPGRVKTPPDACRAAALAAATSFDSNAQRVLSALVAAAPDATLSKAAIADRWPAAGARWGSGAVTLAGDSAHPMTPNLGQGGCVALEDAIVLARCVAAARKAGRPIAEGLAEYERIQSVRARAVAVKSFAVGVGGQAAGPAAPVRNAVLKYVFPMHSFLSHANYDCGGLA